MDDQVDSLMIDVRASTQGFAQDVATMRAAFDGTVVDGFSRAGGVLERGLLGAVRKGSVGFDDLKRTALSAVNEIAAHSLQGLFAGSAAGSGTSVASGLGGIVGALLGLPGRATGGPVSPGAAYVVGERGPEVFVPTSSGRIEPAGGSGQGGRAVNVAISVIAPRDGGAPQSLQRSSRQVASAVRRALSAG